MTQHSQLYSKTMSSQTHSLTESKFRQKFLTLFLIVGILSGFFCFFRMIHLLDQYSSPIRIDYAPPEKKDSVEDPDACEKYPEVGSQGRNQKLSKELIDVNTADEEALMKLPGIGPVLAKEIIKDRENLGPFIHEKDLLRVPGIGEKKFQKILPGLKPFSTSPSLDSVVMPITIQPEANLSGYCPRCHQKLPVSHSRYSHVGPYCPACLHYIQETETGKQDAHG
ncbi:MAG: helix-hairpin-helix domain-containing protein [Candidatus Aureabacteria bacterium]|nr:helix-hairpin-helix domain-containing protein [Candidatus Auribacterota bacterium]